jgi:phosphoglycolate phosphatase-like HAD superfamily hydrolase
MIEGMEEVLAKLQAAGYDMHIMSNYPVWYRCCPYLTQYLLLPYINGVARHTRCAPLVGEVG